MFAFEIVSLIYRTKRKHACAMTFSVSEFSRQIGGFFFRLVHAKIGTTVRLFF